MVWLLLACSGADDLPPTVEAFRGEALLTLEGSHAGPEEIALGWVGWSRFLEDDDLTLVASDDVGVWDLIVRFDGPGAAGEQALKKVFLKKGTQLFLDADATCSATLGGTGGDGDPWGLDLSCADLVTEAGSPNHEDRPFSLEATVSGETFTQDETRGDRWQLDGYSAGPLLRDSPSAPEGVVQFSEPDLAVVLPWRADATWVLFDDGEDGSLDDALLRFSPTLSEWLITRWTRWGLDPAVGAGLQVVADDNLTMGVQGRDEDVTGSAFTLTLWDSLQDDPDDSLVVVVK